MNPDFKKNKLIPVILQDYRTNEVLMLGYMNEKAWERTLKEKIVYFYSRSRKKLWLKGEISGNIQYVKSIFLDCDKDAILIRVKPSGPVCHTGNKSCFFNEVLIGEKTNKKLQNFLEELFSIIEERKEKPIKGSYTSELFSKGERKICEKIGEEATELIISSLQGSKNEIIHESSDLIYHLLVLLSLKNINLEDIFNELLKRRARKID